MKQFLRRGIGTAVVCGVTCGISFGLFCGGCLVGGLTYTWEKMEECEVAEQDMVNCNVARNIQAAAAVAAGCSGSGDP
jgi:hypothetical protein